MTLTNPATLTPSRRAGNLRLAANPLGDGWQQGLDVASGVACLAPVRLGPCAVGDQDPQALDGTQKWQPAYAQQIVKCTALGRPDVGEWAREAGDVTVDYALALELFDGAQTSNPSLSDATVIGEVTGIAGNEETLAAAIACIEASAASSLTGRVAFIHIPQGLAIYLPSSVYRDGSGLWRTPAGNIVVVSPGYSGTSIYGTSEVWVGTERTDTRTFLDRGDNTDQAWDDHLVLAVFDPCFNVEVTTDITECTPPSV